MRNYCNDLEFFTVLIVFVVAVCLFVSVSEYVSVTAIRNAERGRCESKTVVNKTLIIMP